MTKQLITEAIEKLEAAQEELRIETNDLVEGFKRDQTHYEIGKALSELKYTLTKL